jgi:hypothetical protein
MTFATAHLRRLAPVYALGSCWKRGSPGRDGEARKERTEQTGGLEVEGERPKAARLLTRRLSWLRVPEEIPPDVEEVAAPVVERLGFLPNIFRVFALRPEHLRRWWHYYDFLMRGPSNLTKAQREMIAVVVSATNDCHY